MWEGIGDRTELQHIDPHSYGHNIVSFPFSWAAQPGAWEPSLSGTCSSFQNLLSNWSDLQLQLLNRGPEVSLSWVLVFSTASYLQLVLSPTDWTSCALSYIIVRRPLSSFGRHKSHSFNPSTVKVIFWYSSTRCTFYLHWCISYFDSPAQSEVNIQH